MTFLESTSDSSDYIVISGSEAGVNAALNGMTFLADGTHLDGGVLVQVEDGGEDGTVAASRFVQVVDNQTDINPGQWTVTDANRTINNFSTESDVAIAGASASTFGVSYEGGSTVLTYSGNDHTLTLGGYTGALDGTSVQFADGTLLKTAGATGAKVALTGGLVAGGDLLVGSGFADVIKGLDGTDKLWGMGGNDLIYGGIGVDTLIGGIGNDVMYGGFNSTDDGGSDTFVYTFSDNLTDGNDVIYGFQESGDNQDHIMFWGASMADVTITSINGGADTLVSLRDEAVGGVSKVTTIKLVGVASGGVDATDFIFGLPPG